MKVNYNKTNKRIIEEYERLKNDPNQNIGLTVGMPDKNNIFEWQAIIRGPPDTSYSDGIFFLSIKFPVDYPEHCPEVCFKNPIYHINVNPIKSNLPGDEPLGHVSFSKLNLWKPEYKMIDVLANIYELFYEANPVSAYGLERVDEYKLNRSLYERKIYYFTKKYANPKDDNIKIDYDESWDFSYV